MISVQLSTAGCTVPREPGAGLPTDATGRIGAGVPAVAFGAGSLGDVATGVPSWALRSPAGVGSSNGLTSLGVSDLAGLPPSTGSGRRVMAGSFSFWEGGGEASGGGDRSMGPTLTVGCPSFLPSFWSDCGSGAG